MDQKQPKHCPFNHTNCIEERCALWVEVSVIVAGPIPEINDKETAGMCVFLVQARALAIVANRPSVIMAPPMVRRPAIGG